MENKIKELILEAKQGDKEALEEIIKKYTPFVIKIARSIYVKGYDIEDLIAVGHVAIIKAINIYDPGRSDGFTTYIFNTIKTNLYLLIRKAVKEAGCCSLNSLNNEGCELIETLSSDINIEDDMVKKDQRSALSEALKRLSEGEKEIIYWYYFNRRNLKDYASFKGVSYRTAVTRKKKAVAKLKKYLKEMNFFDTYIMG